MDYSLTRSYSCYVYLYISGITYIVRIFDIFVCGVCYLLTIYLHCENLLYPDRCITLQKQLV